MAEVLSQPSASATSGAMRAVADDGQSVRSYRSTSSVTSTKSQYLAAQQAAALGDAKYAAGEVIDDQDTITITETRKATDALSTSTHRYLRKKILGKGGFAKVYGCLSEDSGKEYAVKIVEKKNLVKSRARQKVSPVAQPTYKLREAFR